MTGKTGYRVVGSLIAISVVLLLFGFRSTQQTSAATAVSPTWKTTLAGGRIEESSPAIADIDGDGKREVIIGTTSKGAGAVLSVLEDNGQVKWQVTLDDPVMSSAAIEDLDSPPDGYPEIIITTGGDVAQQRGSVVAYNRFGQRLWKYDTNDAQNTGTPSGNFASPVVGDVDGDSDMEVVVGSWDRNIYMLDHRGQYVWHYHNADTIWSTASLADLDRDGDLEIIVGSDITGGGILLDGYRPTDGGFLLVLDKDGNLLARRQLNETLYSSPVVGDTDLDGDLEIYVGTGMYWYLRGNYTQPYVYGFEVKTESTWSIVDLAGWPKATAYPGMSSPALADLDGDEDLEVVIGTGYTGMSEPGACSGQASDADCHGALYAWHHTGTLVTGFPMWPTDSLNKNAFIQSSPVIGDADGDGYVDILLTMLWDVVVVGRDGIEKMNLHTTYSLFGSPALGDLDNDGRTDIVIGGSAYASSDRGVVYDFEPASASYSTESMPWPTFHGNQRNTGLYPRPPQLKLSMSRVVVMVDANAVSSRKSATFEVRNIGEGAISYMVTSSSSAVGVTPASGTLEDSLFLTLGIDTSSLSDGYHTISLTIRGEVDGEPVLGSPVVMPVLIYKGDVQQVYVPMVSR